MRKALLIMFACAMLSGCLAGAVVGAGVKTVATVGGVVVGAAGDVAEAVIPGDDDDKDDKNK